MEEEKLANLQVVKGGHGHARLRHGHLHALCGHTSTAAGSPVFGTTRNRRDRGGTLSGSCVDSES